MDRSRAWTWMLPCLVALGCGSSNLVVAEDDGGGTDAGDASSESSTNDSSASDATGNPPDARPDGFSDASCKGSHPLLDAGLRYCGPADCYCKDTDACYVKELATACCPSPVKCGG